MPPKKKGGKKYKERKNVVGAGDDISKLLKSILRTYDKNCALMNTVVSPKIKKDLLNCVERETLLVRFIVEALPVEKAEDPQLMLEPLLNALRQERYTSIKELYVWGIPLVHTEIACLGLFLEKQFYPVQKLELMDCLIEAESIQRLAKALPYSLTITQLILDYNEFGDRGVENLCQGLEGTATVLSLSLNYCNLTAVSGSMLGQLVATTTVRELYLDGNDLGCDGAQEIIKLCVEQAELEAFERIQEVERKKLEEEMKDSKKNRFLDNPDETKEKTDGKKKKGKKKKKKKKEPPPPPERGPWLNVLHLEDNGIDAFGRGANFAPLMCMRMFKRLIANSTCFKELDLELNLIGDLGGREIMEALQERSEAKLPGLKVRTTHRMNNATFEAICKLGTGKIAKKKKKGKKKKK